MKIETMYNLAVKITINDERDDVIISIREAMELRDLLLSTFPIEEDNVSCSDCLAFDSGQ